MGLAGLEKRISWLEKAGENKRNVNKGKPVTGNVMSVKKGDIVLLKGHRELDIKILYAIKDGLTRQLKEAGIEAQVFCLPFGADVKVMRKDGE